MSPEKMVRMANQIATFFESQPGKDGAERVAQHLTEFWEPRMLDQLAAHVGAGGDGLRPMALEGARLALAERA